MWRDIFKLVKHNMKSTMLRTKLKCQILYFIIIIRLVFGKFDLLIKATNEFDKLALFEELYTVCQLKDFSGLYFYTHFMLSYFLASNSNYSNGKFEDFVCKDDWNISPPLFNIRGLIHPPPLSASYAPTTTSIYQARDKMEIYLLL